MLLELGFNGKLYDSRAVKEMRLVVMQILEVLVILKILKILIILVILVVLVELVIVWLMFVVRFHGLYEIGV